MLKLEGSNLKLSKTNRFFNQTFLLSFGIAFGIHLLFLAAFHVQLFKFIGSKRVLSSAYVDSSFPDSLEINTSLAHKKDKPHWLKPPKLSTPTLPNIPLVSLPLDCSFKTCSLQVSLSGGLENQTILSTPTLPKETLLSPTTICYRVFLHETTGEIIWYEPFEQIPDQTFLSITETIIRSLKFEKNPRGGILSGIVEVSYL